MTLPHPKTRPVVSRSPSSPSATSRSPSSLSSSASVIIILCLQLLLLLSSPPDAGVQAASRSSPSSSNNNIEFNEIRYWSTRFGKDVEGGSSEATCFRRITENYNSMRATVVTRDAPKLIKNELVKDVESMMKWKGQAVDKIAKEAESLALSHIENKEMEYFPFIHSKLIVDAKAWDATSGPSSQLPHKVSRLDLDSRPGGAFGKVGVNLLESAVHLPINVWEEGPAVLNPLKWSEGLTQTFRNNLAFDPNLSWQYFAADAGFLRLYPAARWRYTNYTSSFESMENSEGAIAPVINFDKVPEGSSLLATAAIGITPPVDLYDARLKDWYIRAAASPKDMIILLDGSGSMTGQRKEIARVVVVNILQTLTDDDFVSVVRFGTELEPVAPCFGFDLVPANAVNVREFREQMEGMNTSGISNFSIALTHAFNALNDAFVSKNASSCNQAIMIVTDGAPDTYEDIFREYNWPRIGVRVFTYLVGRETTETHEVNAIACHNRGYYTHVANFAEVREQVQLHVPVMARPLVLSGPSTRPTAWSPVYADIQEVPMTKWLWEERQKEKIRRAIQIRIQERTAAAAASAPPTPASPDITDGEESDGPESGDFVDPELQAGASNNNDDMEYESAGRAKRAVVRESSGNAVSYDQRNSQPFSPYGSKDPDVREEDGDSNGYDRNEDNEDGDQENDDDDEKRDVNLMITVSAPVFDLKNTTNVTYRVLVKNMWEKHEKEIRTANLLGVAGVDIPIREIRKFVPSYKLGVNGYSFMITNNGFLLYHPDLRPLFRDMLVPFYAAVDMTQVELPDRDMGPTDVDPEIDSIRRNMIDQQLGWSQRKVDVRIHSDSLRRVASRTHKYYYAPVNGTTYSLAIVLPEPYGHYKVEGQIEIKRREENYTQYFTGKDWRVHPDWLYCENPIAGSTGTSGSPVPLPGGNGGMSGNQSPEEIIRSFLEQPSSNLRWRTASNRPAAYEQWSCERELVQSLVFDAKATQIDPKKCGPPKSPAKYEREIAKTYGIVLTFTSTRSGLTRFQEYGNTGSSFRSSASFLAHDRPPAEAPVEVTSAFYQRPGKGRRRPKSFREEHVRATDEDFYKRAVDFSKFNTSSFVYSVPIDAGASDGVLVTASRAVILGSSKQKAPAAVVGLQYQHKLFADRFFNHTEKCGSKDCRIKCRSETTECLLMDNSGFIIVSEDDSFTGRHVSEYDYELLQSMTTAGVYEVKRLLDHQAMCIDSYQVNSLASLMSTPFHWMGKAVLWLWAKVTIAALDVYLNGILHSVKAVVSAAQSAVTPMTVSTPKDGIVLKYEGEIPFIKTITKTKPRPCVREHELYESSGRWLDADQASSAKYRKCPSFTPSCEPTWIAHPVPFSNLISLVILNTCHCGYSAGKRLEPRDVSSPGNCTGLPADRYRKRPTSCISSHPQEELVKVCGRAAGHLTANPLLLILSSLICAALIVPSSSSSSSLNSTVFHSHHDDDDEYRSRSHRCTSAFTTSQRLR